MKKFLTFGAIALCSVSAIGCNSNTPLLLDYSDALSSECDIIRDQFKQSQSMLRETGREMDRQAARDGIPTNFEQNHDSGDPERPEMR